MEHDLERRASLRVALERRIIVHHSEFGRQCPGRTVNISSAGVLLRIPLSLPAAVGQSLEFELGAEQQPVDLEGESVMHRRKGTIVRVDRSDTLDGELLVAMQF